MLVSQSSCEAAASPFPITARRPVLWCSGIRNRMPWIALSEHTIPVCGQVPVARRSHHPAMYALHTSRSQRAWLRLFFLAVRMLASALSSHVPVTCLQKISCPGSPCKRPRLGHVPWSGSTGGTHGCVPMRACRRRVQLRRRRARASSSVVVIVLRSDAAQSTGAGGEAPAEVEVPAGSAGHELQSGPPRTHSGPCTLAPCPCPCPAQARTRCWRWRRWRCSPGPPPQRWARAARPRAAWPGTPRPCSPASTPAASRSLAPRDPGGGARCGRGARPAVRLGPPPARRVGAPGASAPPRIRGRSCPTGCRECPERLRPGRASRGSAHPTACRRWRTCLRRHAQTRAPPPARNITTRVLAAGGKRTHWTLGDYIAHGSA